MELKTQLGIGKLHHYFLKYEISITTQRQLEKLQQEIEKDIVKKKTQDDSQLIKAVALYSKMDAGIAAQSLALLERKIAVKILKQMKEKQASLILSNMGADESASMIEEITRKK